VPALGERLRLSGAKAVFCADITYRKGNDVPLKPIVDEAVEAAGSVQHVVVLRCGAAEPAMRAGRDIFWEEFLAGAQGHSGGAEWLESNEPLFILATPGTTATPKLAVHAHGGYQVYIHATGDWVFGLREDDVWWSTSDIGALTKFPTHPASQPQMGQGGTGEGHTHVAERECRRIVQVIHHGQQLVPRTTGPGAHL
jgi:acetyl-CoA synthetase